MSIAIPLAVYTATEGYGWHCGNAFPLSVWEGFRRLIGRLPDIDSGELPFGGAFSAPEGVVVYRCFINRHADSKGRNALYLILGVIPQETAKSVDFSLLYQSPEFSGPMKPFPTKIFYSGATTEPTSFPLNMPFEKDSNDPALFRQLGCCFTHGSKLKVQICGSILQPSFHLSYQPPPPTLSRDSTQIETATPPRQFSSEVGAPQKNEADAVFIPPYQPIPEHRQPRIQVLVAILLFLLLLLLALKCRNCFTFGKQSSSAASRSVEILPIIGESPEKHSETIVQRPQKSSSGENRLPIEKNPTKK